MAKASERYFSVKTTIMANATTQVPAGKPVTESYLTEQGCDVAWLIKMGTIEEVVFQSVLVPTTVAEKSTVLEASGAQVTPVGLLDSSKEVPAPVEETTTAPTTKKPSK